MSKPQQSISVQFGSEWRIRRPHLYRHLEKRFVDEFFETGALRLSSFEKFSQHTDEQRLDSSEGKGIITHINTEGEGQTLIAGIAQGQNAYVLCSSSMYRDDLAESFMTDSGFRVNDIFGFANAISRHVPGFVAGLEGPCLYLQKRVLDRDMGRIDLDSLRVTPDSKDLDLGKMMQTVFSMTGDDLFFLKDSKYANQNEYRLLWVAAGQISPHLDIKCPEVRAFCTRFEDLRTEMEG